MRLVGHVARMGDSRGAYGVLVATPEGRKPLGRLRHTWEDNNKMDFMCSIKASFIKKPTNALMIMYVVY